MDDIWVIRGSRPVLWTMPYRVRWQGNQAELLRVLPPLPAPQERALMEFFERHNGNRFTITQLKAVGDPLPVGTDALETFSWERPRMAQLSAYKPERRQDRDDFLDATYQRGLGRSRDEVEFWWNQFCNAALDWLINRERPLDLYFAKIHPTPLRAGWKNIVRSYSKTRRFAGIPKAIEAGILLATNGQTCQRRLDIEFLKPWTKTTSRVEMTRLLRLGRAGYARQIIISAQRQAAVSERIYRQWKADSAAESVVFCPGIVEGAMGIAPPTRHRRLGKRNVELRRLARQMAFKPRPRKFEPRGRKKSSVRRLRVVRPQIPDVWDGRSYLSPSDNRKSRLDGVLVLLAAQKRHADELLALRANEGRNGVGPGVEQLAG